MIEKLSAEQEGMIPVYIERYIKKGLCTDRVSLERAREISDYYYKNIKGTKPVPVILVDSPLDAWNKVKGYSENMNQLYGQIRGQIGIQIWDQFRGQIRGQIEDQIGDNYIHPYIEGHIDTHLFAYFSYIRDILGVKYRCNDKYNWYESTLEIGNFYPLEDVCIISQKPTRINMVDGRLHCDGGASIEYADGFKIWSLNGIRVEQYLAETPTGNLSLEYYHKIESADIKAEFIKKFGIERMVELGTIIDSYKNYSELNEYWRQSEYELIDMANIHEGLDKALYLKMKNLSVEGLYHLEGVSNDCSTIYDALGDRWNENPLDYTTINIK